MNEAIVFNHVTKCLGDFKLDTLTFSVKQGYITGFIGPNGAGKTSTIRLIMNLLRPDAGQVQVFGLDSVKHGKEIRQRIGFVYSENYFYNEWTIEKTKWVVSSFYKKWDEKLFDRYSLKFDLPRKKKVKHLSTGMRMKFFLALALSHHADLLVLDEPTTGLDPLFRRELLDLLMELVRDEGKTIFFSTHITTDLDQLADFVTVINQGKVICSEAKEEILDRYFLMKGPIEALNEENRSVLIGCREMNMGFEALIRKSECTPERFARIVTEIPTLEEIMIYLARGDSK